MKIPGNLPSGSGGAGLQSTSAHAVAGARSPNGAQESTLERCYPGVVRAVVMMWGYPELTEFFERVAAGLDERLRNIEPAAMAELMLLAQVHRAFCPPRARQAVDSHPALRGAGGWRPAGQRG